MRYVVPACAWKPTIWGPQATMESGGDPSKGPDAQDGEFWPDYRTQYPKIRPEYSSYREATDDSLEGSALMAGRMERRPQSSVCEG